MGEAKRRKQLDPSYGRIPSLTSQNQKAKHLNRILDEINRQFEITIKQIASADSIFDSYAADRQRVSDWLDNQLKNYSTDDRTMLASSIMSVYAEMAMKYETSPLLIKFWYEILKSFLDADKKDRIKTIVEKIEQAGFSS